MSPFEAPGELFVLHSLQSIDFIDVRNGGTNNKFAGTKSLAGPWSNVISESPGPARIGVTLSPISKFLQAYKVLYLEARTDLLSKSASVLYGDKVPLIISALDD